MSPFWTTITVLVLLLNVIAHEAAHALALRKIGGTICRAGLGLPLPPMLLLLPRGRRRFELTLTPWLLGAYVEPDLRSKKLIETARYWDQAWFAGAGVVANLIGGSVMVVGVAVIDGKWSAVTFWLVVAALIWFLRRVITALLPVLGLAALVLVAWSLALSFGEPIGPIGLGQAVVSSDARDSLAISVALAFGLAALNMIPIYPFDGGRVADAALTKLLGNRASRWFRGTTTVAAAALLLYAIGSDAWALMT